jgi:hypothetical protein
MKIDTRTQLVDVVIFSEIYATGAKRSARAFINIRSDAEPADEADYRTAKAVLSTS